VPPAADGPVPVLLATELSLARSGALDSDLISGGGFYGTNSTKPLLFLEDGQYFANVATADHLTGTQWGVMNETGSYRASPGCGSTPCGTRSRASTTPPTSTSLPST